MEMAESQELLVEYARNGSEAAFHGLVTRYVGLVYSAAFRMVDGQEDLAQDIAQTVFIDLARLAGTLSSDVLLGGWLHRHTCFVAAKAMRTERRRKSRERQAVEMSTLLEHPEIDFSGVAPILDEAINQLGEEDRTAILLRFFDQADFRSVGTALGSTEDAARMRVGRALEKLRSSLEHRGFKTTATALSAAISAQVTQAAPVGLAAAISKVAFSSAILHVSTTVAATKAVAMTVLQKGLLAAALLVFAGVGAFQTNTAIHLQQELSATQRGKSALSEQLARLRTESESLSNQLAQASAVPGFRTDRLRELLRLRGEVGLLRRRQREMEQALATGGSSAPQLAGQALSSAPPTPGVHAPFQLQLVLAEPDENSEALTNFNGGARGEVLQVQKTPLLDYTALRSASVRQNSSTGAPEIEVEFSPEGSELFAAVTREHLNQRLAIVLDGQVYQAPVIRSEIPGGKAQITGNFTELEAREIAAKINGAISGP